MNHKENLQNVAKNKKLTTQIIPTEMNAFSDFSKTVYKDGVLDAKTKELLALAIAIAVRCEGCIESHISKFVSIGGTKEELAETVAVAMAMGGGPSMVYGGKALEAFEQFSVK